MASSNATACITRLRSSMTPDTPIILFFSFFLLLACYLHISVHMHRCGKTHISCIICVTWDVKPYYTATPTYIRFVLWLFTGWLVGDVDVLSQNS